MKHLKLYNENIEMPSIFTKKIVYSVDCSDLASLIQKLYGKYPEIEASLELGHDETYEIEANAEEFSENEFQSWLNIPKYQRSEIYMLMAKLSLDGHIIDGDYLIKTC